MKRIHIVLIISILLISTLGCQTVSSLLQSQAGDSIIEEPSTLAWPTPEVSERSVVITQQGDLAELEHCGGYGSSFLHLGADDLLHGG